jgi:hypothetical protein
MRGGRKVREVKRPRKRRVVRLRIEIGWSWG